MTQLEPEAIAAQLIEAAATDDDIALYDALGAIARNGIRAAVAVSEVLARQCAAATRPHAEGETE